MPTNIKYTDYQLERERIGGIASLDWRPSDTTHLWARGLYSKFTENEYRQRFRLDFATQAQRDNGTVTLTPDGLTGVSTVTEKRSDLRLEYKEKSVLVDRKSVGQGKSVAVRVDLGWCRVCKKKKKK